METIAISSSTWVGLLQLFERERAQGRAHRQAAQVASPHQPGIDVIGLVSETVQVAGKDDLIDRGQLRRVGLARVRESD